MLIDLIIREVVCLQHIYLLGDLLGYFLNGVFIRPCGNGVLMYALDGRSRNIQTLDIDLATGKHCGYLVQQTGEVLRMNDYRI